MVMFSLLGHVAHHPYLLHAFTLCPLWPFSWPDPWWELSGCARTMSRDVGNSLGAAFLSVHREWGVQGMGRLGMPGF